MPIIIGSDPKKSSSNLPKKPRVLLKTAVPMLTGRPTSTIGWFSSTYKTLGDRFDSLQKQVEAIISQKGTSVSFEKGNATPSSSYLNTVVDLTDDKLKIKSFFSKEYNTTVEAYICGFNTLSTTYNKKSIKMLVPTIGFKINGGFIAVSSESIDPEYFSSLDKSMIALLDEISMTEFYDALMRYYFNTDFNDMLSKMPKIGKNTYSDIDIVESYKIIKSINGLIKFNAAQLSAFVTSLITETNDYAKLKQIILQFPELTFASLSQQFEALEPTLKPLI